MKAPSHPDFSEFVRAAYRAPVNKRGSRLVAAAIGAVAVLALAACGAIPPSDGGLTGAPSRNLPSPTTVIPPEPSSPSDSPPPKTPATPKPAPKPTPTQPAAGPDCDKLKCIALTYDDGPFPDTSRLTEVMRQEKVRATFFMLGQNVVRYPQTVKDVVATGSELANHSWNHASLPGLGTDAMRSQLRRTNQAIKEVAGIEVTLMRPPYGATNQRLDDVCRELGLAEIYWNVDTLDWKYSDSDRLIDYVLGHAARDKVVLMHDIHGSTVDASQAIFRGLKKRGYTLVTVTELYPKLRAGGHYPLFQGRGFAKKSDYPRGTSASR